MSRGGADQDRACAELVPGALRTGWGARWHHADRLARAFGTTLTRYRWWRAPMRVAWLVILTIGRDHTAARGRACLLVEPVRPRLDQALRVVLVPAAVLSMTVPAGLVVDVVRADRLGAWVAGEALLAAVTVVLGAETVAMLCRSGALLLGGGRGVDAVRRAGHIGPLVRLSTLSGAGDAGVLARVWLRHADRNGIAVVAAAATEDLARRYTRPAAGFVRVSAHSRQLYRLPRPAPAVKVRRRPG